MPLASVSPGQRVTVVATDGRLAAELAREGILPGTVVSVISRTPLGGPTVIDAGRARLAISSDVAAGIRVSAAPEPTSTLASLASAAPGAG